MFLSSVVSLCPCQNKVSQKSVRAHQMRQADLCALHLHPVQLFDADKSSFVIGLLATGDSTGS